MSKYHEQADTEALERIRQKAIANEKGHCDIIEVEEVCITEISCEEIRATFDKMMKNGIS